MSMTSSKPYIIRALYDWILDNECTPYVIVNAMAEDTMVPQEYVKNGQIVLNISPVAIEGLVFSNERMEFKGRFDGVSREVIVPMSAVMGIHTRETGQGMMFELEENLDPDPSTPPTKPGPSSSSKVAKPSLKVVK